MTLKLLFANWAEYCKFIQRVFSAQSAASMSRSVWKWPEKTHFQRAFSALFENFRHYYLPDFLHFVPTGGLGPWGSSNNPRHERSMKGFMPVELCIKTDAKKINLLGS